MTPAIPRYDPRAPGRSHDECVELLIRALAEGLSCINDLCASARSAGRTPERSGLLYEIPSDLAADFGRWVAKVAVTTTATVSISREELDDGWTRMSIIIGDQPAVGSGRS